MVTKKRLHDPRFDLYSGKFFNVRPGVVLCFRELHDECADLFVEGTRARVMSGDALCKVYQAIESGLMTEAAPEQEDDIKKMLQRAAARESDAKRLHLLLAPAELAFQRELKDRHYPAGAAANLAAAKALLRRSR